MFRTVLGVYHIHVCQMIKCNKQVMKALKDVQLEHKKDILQPENMILELKKIVHKLEKRMILN